MLHYYNETFESCTKNFLSLAKAVAQTWPNSELGTESVANTQDDLGDPLSIPYVSLPPTEKTELLVILYSGVHGIEGFVGSAIQQFYLEKILPILDHKRVGHLVVHGVNPWGFWKGRRVTQTGVDLNRNVTKSHISTAQQLEQLENLRSFLAPSQPASLGILPHACFELQALLLVLRYGLGTIRHLLLEGHHAASEFPYFGGRRLEPNVDSFRNILKNRVSSYEKILEISLHTGYGRKGQLHVLPGHAKTAKTDLAISLACRGIPLEKTGNEDFYKVEGDFSFATVSLLHQEQLFLPLALEFGTHESLSAIGAIKALRTIVLENQLFCHGATTPTQARRIENRFRDTFYPKSQTWRRNALEQAKNTLTTLIQQFIEKH